MRNQLSYESDDKAMPLKRCRMCDQEKTIHYFPLHEWNRSPGQQPACTKCLKEYNERHVRHESPWRRSMSLFFEARV